MKILLLNAAIFFLVSCSFQASEKDRITGLNPGLSNGDGIPIEEDSNHVFDISELYNDPTFFDKYEVTSVYSRDFQVSLSDANQKIYLQPFPHFSGQEVVSIYLKDRSDNSLLTGAVRFQVSQEPDAPSAFEDHFQYDGSSPIQLDVLANDVDVDGDSLGILDVTAVENATITIANSKITLTPGPDFEIAIDGTVEFEYTLSDGTGLVDTATVVLFNGDNAPLVAGEGLIPLKIVFLKSSDASLTTDYEADADEALRIINSKLKNEDQSFSGFYKYLVEEIEDNELYTMCDPTAGNCIDYDKLVSRYNFQGVVTLVFVNSILGSVAGVARVNRLPFSTQATVVSEYRGLKRSNRYEPTGTVYVHEIGHLLGLEHTQQIGQEVDTWINYFSCSLGLSYFQRAGSFQVDPYEDKGISWDDYHNTMKSVISSQSLDEGFFTSGYDQTFNKIFSCYRARTLL